MDPASAFQVGSGSSLIALALLVAGIGCTVVLLWAGWALISGFRGFAHQRLPGVNYQNMTLRIFLIIVLMFWILLS
ncbi:TIGR03758 family integrating conjugative element protein [Alcanivoracaceae bacterium MT1]